MAKQLVDIGTVPNDGTGDPLRVAMDKINDNVNEIYNSIGDGTDLTAIINAQGHIDVGGEPNKVSFWYSTINDLPNATLYQGCIAYVQSEGAVYYSHGADGWRKLLSDNANTLDPIAAYTDNLARVAYTGNVNDLIGNIGGGGGGGGTSNTFSRIAVAGQSDIVADNTSDTLTLIAGSNMTITTNATSDTLTFSAQTGGGGGGGGTSNAFSTIAVSGQSSLVADGVLDTLNVANGEGIIISTTPATDTLTITATGGNGLQTRQDVSTTLTNMSAGATVTPDIVGPKGYALFTIQTDFAAWVRVYSDQASRTADASRTELQDPLPDAGVIAEVITTGNETVKFTPAAIGFNNESTPVNEIYLRVTNKTGATATINVTLTLLQIEA
jgi:hypothetical protein